MWDLSQNFKQRDEFRKFNVNNFIRENASYYAGKKYKIDVKGVLHNFIVAVAGKKKKRAEIRRIKESTLFKKLFHRKTVFQRCCTDVE